MYWNVCGHRRARIASSIETDPPLVAEDVARRRDPTVQQTELLRSAVRGRVVKRAKESFPSLLSLGPLILQSGRQGEASRVQRVPIKFLN